MADCAICVAIRARPLLKNETKASETLSFEGSSTLHLHKKSYTFDCVFQPGISNESVYKAVVASKIRPLFDGYNVTILAYGPTGSGKTYTMGTDYNPKNISNKDIGIIPRGVQEIFRLLESQQQTTDFSVKVSFLELYREEIFDLLRKRPAACNLREDADGVKVVNLTEVPVKSVEEAFRTLAKGSSLRHTSATAKNLQSSRSHAIFSVYIEQTDKQTFNFKRSKFQLVDLAGSERMSTSKTAGLQIKEGININMGLLSLGKVILHLIEDRPHIPYRDSKLTRLLQDSLGGNSHTVMIACVNPSSTSTEETMSTLRYASNARRIKNRPVVNLDPPSVQIEKLKKQIQGLQAALFEQNTSGSTSIVSEPPNLNKLEAAEYEMELQDSYAKICALNSKLCEIEEKHTLLLERIESLCESIKEFVAEMTVAAATEPNLQQYVGKFEEMYHNCRNMIDSSTTPNILGIDEGSLAEESSNLEESTDSDMELKNLSKINEKQKARTETLANISRTLNLKVDQAKNIEAFVQSYETHVNEEYLETLVTKIQALVQEKTSLQESMREAKDRVKKESEEKILKYEQQIVKLKEELRKNKVVLQMREEHRIKIVQLQKEIKELKTLKVQLVKQMKEETNRYMQKQREKDREVAKLVREGRKKEHELVKMKVKFEKEVNVLKQKIDRANASRKKIVIRKKDVKKGDAKSRPSVSSENIEEWLSEEIKVRVQSDFEKVENEMIVKKAEALQEYINNLEQRSEENPEGPDLTSQKVMLETLFAKIREGDQNVKNETACPLLDGVSSMGQAKIAIENLFKKCVAAQVENKKQQIFSNEQLKNEKANVDASEGKIKSLEHEIKNLKEILNACKLEHDENTASLKYEYDAKIIHLLNEIQFANKASLTSDVDSALADRINMQEKEIERLQGIHKDYENKCKEIDALQQQLFKAKKGKKVPWIGNLTSNPSGSQTFTTSLEDNKTSSMLEEYLTDSADESFGYDRNDPDWRLTPAYKQRKEKAALKRHHPEHGTTHDDSSDSSSPKRKNVIFCRCRTDCRSQRCRCKKYEVKCNDLCACKKNLCLNLDEGKEGAELSFKG